MKLKSLISILIGIIILNCLNVPTFAAKDSSMHMVLGVGRTSAVVRTGTNVKIETLGKSEEGLEAMYYMPLIDNGTTYVPLRYIMETAGLIVDWDDDEESVILKTRSGAFSVWVDDNAKGVKKISAKRVDYKNNTFTVITQNSNETPQIKSIVSKTFFGRTYIPVRALERFEFVVHWNNEYQLVHIIKDSSRDFSNAFQDIINETNSTRKNAKTAEFYDGIRQSSAFSSALESYIYSGTDYNNNINNGLALKTSDGVFISTLSASSKKDVTAVASGARQLTYTTAGNKKWIYYINKSDKKLYKTEVKSGTELGERTKVRLPANLSGASVTQLIIAYDRIFFIAYDKPQNGGYVYMAMVGNEEKTVVKLTQDRAWNTFLSNDFQLYYTNFDDNCSLYAIDLKQANNLTNLYQNGRTSGISGLQKQRSGIQSIAYDKQHQSKCYYTDIASGSVCEMTIDSAEAANHEIISKNGNSLYNFLNLYSEKDDLILYYIEYPNGRINNFDNCKIMSYDINTKKTKTVYTSDKMIMQLTIIDRNLYCTDEKYAHLYKISVNDKGYTFEEVS